MQTLLSPKGDIIVGTLETVAGVALVQNPTRDSNGQLDFEYAGETKIWWDEQKTVHRDSQRVFIDEYGNHWLECELEIGDVPYR